VTRAPTYTELGRRLRARYDDVLDRVGLYGDATRIEQRDVIDLAAVLDA